MFTWMLRRLIRPFGGAVETVPRVVISGPAQGRLADGDVGPRVFDGTAAGRVLDGHAMGRVFDGEAAERVI